MMVATTTRPRRRPPLCRLALICISLAQLSLVEGFSSASLTCSTQLSSVERFSSAPLNRQAVPRATVTFQARHVRSSTHPVHLSTVSEESGSSEGAMTTAKDDNVASDISITLFQQMAQSLVSEDYAKNPAELRMYVQYITVFRVGLPALAVASASCLAYPAASMALAGIIDDSRAFAVIAQDSSQYIQNILTTCGLMFSILVGYTYYFLYQQQVRREKKEKGREIQKNVMLTYIVPCRCQHSNPFISRYLRKSQWLKAYWNRLLLFVRGESPCIERYCIVLIDTFERI